MQEINNLNLRSEEVQDILTRVPHWIIRCGTMVVAVVILLLFFSSWFIKYPDVINTQITITTNIPPEKLVAKTSGRIEAILVKNKTKIIAGTPLAIIENTANYKDVFQLSKVISQLQSEKSLKKFPFSIFKNAQFGDIETFFAVFQKESISNNLNAELHPFAIETQSQSYEAIQLRERLELLESQKDISQNELSLQKNDLKRYESLFKKGIIADQEFEQHKLTCLQVEKNYKNTLSTISSLKSSLNELSKNTKTNQINENKEIVNLERNVIHAFYQLKKAIKDWELNYVFRSSIDGKVSFLQVWAANQTVNSGDDVFAIIPDQENGYIGKIKAPALNSGKIRTGQQVNIRLVNYPDKEFGILKGSVRTISLVPDKDGNLLIDILLPKALETSYNKQIIFQQEMTGTAEIVTEDLRLIERLLYQFRSIFKNA